MATAVSQRTGEPDETTVRRAVTAAAMGNGMEWYDYGVYSYMAVTIGRVFFPSSDQFSALLASYGVLAVSFLLRPLGSIVLGPLGDRFGRKQVLTITIIVMACSTFSIGVFPGYATIGIGAPILLIAARMVQGFSTGGEYGGAATFIAEYAPTNRRGFWGSWLEFGTLSGYTFGAVLVTILQLSLPSQSFDSWAYRIPFLIALPLGLIGMYLRYRLADTPAFEAMERENKVDKAPLRHLVRDNWRQILKLFGMVLILNVADYTLLTYMPTYLQDILKISATKSLLITIAIYLCMMAVISPLGALSDRVGRKPLLMGTTIGLLVLAYPVFYLINQRSWWAVILGLAIFGFLLVVKLALIGSTYPALFPAKARYGSMAIGYNIPTAVFGGTAAVVYTELIHLTGDVYIPAYYLMLASVIGIIAIATIPETARRSVRQADTIPGTTVEPSGMPA